MSTFAPDGVSVLDGKYTVVGLDDGTGLRALRWGDEWRNLVGDNLVFALAWELHEARELIVQLQAGIEAEENW